MAHLPLSYEDRCSHFWFAKGNVHYYLENPMHFCTQSRGHPFTCECKCGAISGIAVTAEARNTSELGTNGRGSNGNDILHLE
jgi:hypothetical protein